MKKKIEKKSYCPSLLFGGGEKNEIQGVSQYIIFFKLTYFFRLLEVSHFYGNNEEF